MITNSIVKASLRLITFLFIIMSFSFILSSNSLTMADSKSEVCQGIQEFSSSTSCNKVTQKNSIGNLVKTVVTFLSYIVGIAAVIMFVVGGLKFILSGGDSNKVSEAKTTIIYAVIGLVVAALASLIVHLVINSAIKVS